MPISEKIRYLAKSRVVGNMIALYGIHATNIVLPLLMIPFVARMLQPSGFGRITLAQGVAVYLTTLVGYGFNGSATRQLARCAQDSLAVRSVISGVIGAKIALAVASFLIVTTAVLVIPALRDNLLVSCFAAIWGVASGFHASWYFQGLQDLKKVAVTEVVVKIIFVAAVFVVVRKPSDDWKFIALLASAQLIINGIMIGRMFYAVGFVLPNVRDTAKALSTGWHLFVFSLTQDAVAGAGVVLVGILSSPSAAACFGSSDKLIRAIRVSLNPLFDASFPKLSYLAQHDRGEGLRIIRLLLILGAAVGFVSFGIMQLLAPLAIQLLLGPGYEAAIPILRILAAIIPLMIIGQILGAMWAHPLGLDSAMTRVTVVSALVLLASGFILTLCFGAAGMAAACVLSSSVALFGYVGILSKNGEMPWLGSVKELPSEETPAKFNRV